MSKALSTVKCTSTPCILSKINPRSVNVQLKSKLHFSQWLSLEAGEECKVLYTSLQEQLEVHKINWIFLHIKCLHLSHSQLLDTRDNHLKLAYVALEHQHEVPCTHHSVGHTDQLRDYLVLDYYPITVASLDLNSLDLPCLAFDYFSFVQVN